MIKLVGIFLLSLSFNGCVSTQGVEPENSSPVIREFAVVSTSIYTIEVYADGVYVKFNEEIDAYAYGVTWNGKYQGIILLHEIAFFPVVALGKTNMILVHYDEEGMKTGKIDRLTVEMPDLDLSNQTLINSNFNNDV